MVVDSNEGSMMSYTGNRYASIIDLDDGSNLARITMEDAFKADMLVTEHPWFER